MNVKSQFAKRSIKLNTGTSKKVQEKHSCGKGTQNKYHWETTQRYLHSYKQVIYILFIRQNSLLKV